MTPKTNDNQEHGRIYLLWLTDLVRASQPGSGLVCATTSLFKLRKAVEFCIHSRSVSYGNDKDTAPIPEQIRALRADWKNLSRTELNERLGGGYLQVEQNGDIL